ncbi:Nn.00g112270.m01.CDS01 [Neocucurbitaria sp. VM-36]
MSAYHGLLDSIGFRGSRHSKLHQQNYLLPDPWVTHLLLHDLHDYDPGLSPSPNRDDKVSKDWVEMDIHRNGYNIFIFAQAECQLTLICASLPFLQHFFAPRPTVPVVSHSSSDMQRQSITSRLSDFVRSSVKCFSSPGSIETNPSTPLPREAAIPEWELEALQSPGGTFRPSIETTYERYRKGDFGPPVPPKDLGDWLEVYRRDHGQMIRGYPF